MTTPLWCLVLVAVFPILLAFTGGYFRMKDLGAMDNKEPRAQATQLTGAGARAYAAQGNAWEALAMFTAAVMIAHVTGVGAGGAAANAAMLFVVMRVLHAVFYLANLDALRSLAFVAGVGCCGWLIYLSASN